MMLVAILSLVIFHSVHSFSPKDDSYWSPLPHVERRDVLLSTLALSSSPMSTGGAAAAANADAGDNGGGYRSVISLESNPAIPVWPTWGGGKVSLGGQLQDPFLLLAHHDHWFDPRDPLRGPFKAVGKALGLPYVDVEGFSMHPHRGFDIFTYILDGSDGFQHRDSLGSTSKLYKGGTAQFMRTGSGVLHEEFWETNPKRRTNIELFQLWVNLPASLKFDQPAIHYIGQDTPYPWIETNINDPNTGSIVGSVRDISGTLDKVTTIDEEKETTESSILNPRPPMKILHTKLEPGGVWNPSAPSSNSAVIYVRDGSASISNGQGDTIIAKTRQTVTFAPDGHFLSVENKDSKKTLDMIALIAMPLKEPVASAGPIVMNTADEINDAYQQLQDGTFLKRDYVLQQQKAKGYL